MRATGRRLGNPAAEQAKGPPTNPVEMGLPDIACVVYRASQRPYHAMFESVWGQQAFASAWPSDVEHVCASPIAHRVHFSSSVSGSDDEPQSA